MAATSTMTWDEPAQASSPRGWLHMGSLVTGFYLDYGPDSHRAPHAEMLNTVNGPRMRVWCEPGRECRECQPGNILACRYPDGPGSQGKRSRYVETVEQARRYVETGTP